MQNENLLSTTKDLIYLISCALNEKTPTSDYIHSFDFSKIYKLAKFHSLEAVSYSALESYLKTYPNETLDIPEEINVKWRSNREQNAKKSIMFSFEREKLFKFFEEQGIWYLPMKGIHLCTLYPVNGWRYFADNDILFDPSARKSLRKFMVANGYTTKIYNKSKHDVYLKKPCYNFEMHISLFGEHLRIKELNKLHRYYKDIFNRLIRNSNDSFEYHMTNEDFYIFFIAHAYTHHLLSGTGLRTFVDAYVYYKAFNNRLDNQYISNELKKIGVSDFEKSVQNITEKLFSSDFSIDLTAEEEEMLLFYATSGTYGTLNNTVSNNIARFIATDKNKSPSFFIKLKYCFTRVFPSLSFYKENYPIAYKYKVLIPFVFVKRVFKSIFINKNAISEFKYLRQKNIDNEKKQ